MNYDDESVTLYTGDVIVMNVNGRQVVDRADPYALITSEMLREVIEGRTFIEFGEGVLRFGTEGEGLGVVEYEVYDPRFLDWHRERVELLALSMRRIA